MSAHHPRRRSDRAVFVLAAIALLVGLISWPPHAGAQPDSAGEGGIGIRLLEAPAGSRADPRAQAYIVDHLAPGTTIERRIEVANTTAGPVRIGLYPAAADVRNGAFVGAPDRTLNELSTWVSVDPADTEVAAGQKVRGVVTIAVPGDAPPGEQYAVVWAETRSGDAATGVVQVSRVGIRIYLSVGPGNAPAADFTLDSLAPGRTPDGEPVVSADVHNTGGRAIDLSGSLSLTSGPGSLTAGPFPAALGSTLAPGERGPVTITLDRQLPVGPWEAELTLRSGLVERSAAASVTFPDSGTAGSVALTSGSRPVWPIAAGLVAAAAGALGAVLVWRRRRAVRGR